MVVVKGPPFRAVKLSIISRFGIVRRQMNKCSRNTTRTLKDLKKVVCGRFDQFRIIFTKAYVYKETNSSQ